MEIVMEEATKLAVKNGYIAPEPIELDGIKFRNKAETVQDPLFWQALGRALGWGDGGWVCTTCNIPLNECFSPDVHTSRKDKTWLEYSLQYFELKLTGGDESKFWKELVGSN